MKKEPPFLEIPNKEVHLIRLGVGPYFRIQYQGTSCLQYTGKGKKVASFHSISNHFNPDWWYSMCSWYLDDNLLLFTKGLENFKLLNIFSPNVNSEAYYARWKPKAIDGKQLLTQILKEASEATSRTLVPTGYAYGKDWHEALIPVAVDGVPHILTWNNCD